MRVYLIVVVLTLVAFALGMWDVYVQRTGGDWLMQTILPILLIVVLAGLYSKARGARVVLEDEVVDEEQHQGPIEN